MTDFRASPDAVPITHVNDLVALLHEGSKPRATWRIGTEWEKLVVDPATGAAAPFDGPQGVERVLLELADRFGWAPMEENGRVVALGRDGASITLEPGGQLELSGAPCANLHETQAEIATHVHELRAVGETVGVGFLGLGMQPVSPADAIAWVPKRRYAIMGPYMLRVGTRGHQMMKQTATVQANVDWSDERDAMRKLRAGMGIAPLVNAAFANSCVSNGDLNGYTSMRAAIWEDTDRARCGLLPFAFRRDATFRDYVEWALDVPLYFVLRDGRYVTDVTGLPFRRFLAEGCGPHRATVDDWKLHLTTLFPEVRLKSFLELRAADGQPPELVVALPALVKGLFYEDDCLDATLDLVKRWSFAECAQLYHDVAREGLAPRIRGVSVRELLRELVEIAMTGLRRHGIVGPDGRDERLHLAALEERVDGGRTMAREVTDAWSGRWNRDMRRLVAHARFA